MVRSEPAVRTVTHPVVIGSALLILVNDFVLRSVVPGWVTGKLSDVGWLVVVPVVLADLVQLARVPRRVARPLAVTTAASLYTLLQVWPPLGSWLRADHVADLGDLIALPALLGALFVWRAPPPNAIPIVLAWPLVLGTLVADSWVTPERVSWPCGSGMAWSTAEPLRLRLDWVGSYNSDVFVRGLVLVDADDNAVPLVVAGSGGDIAVCARDGLRANVSYRWTIGPWDTPSNEVAVNSGGLPTVTFVTTDAEGRPAEDSAACAALVTRIMDDAPQACGGDYRDTGDSGDSGDMGDTGDTGDSGDTGDTGDSGDRGDTAVVP